jgi:protocatechuate 3,4-dioxygenase beta subunit
MARRTEGPAKLFRAAYVYSTNFDYKRNQLEMIGALMRPRLQPAALLLSLFLPSLASAAVTGYAVNSDGQPIAGAKVSLFAPEPLDARRARLLSATPQRAALATAESGTTGRFTIEAPKEAPAVVDVQVEARGFAPSLERMERDDDAGAIALTPAAEKRGTITAAGKPVTNATVIWSSGAEEVIAKTDAEGHYAVADPARWANHLIVIHPDFAIAEESFTPFEGGRPQLDRALNGGVAVAGRVVGEDGQTPVAKAEVAIGELRLATSGDDGTFSIAHAPAKWETITARTATLLGSRARTANGPITIRLGRATSIGGTVRNAKTQAVLAGAEVRLSRPVQMGRAEPLASALTDAKGNYTLPPVPPGTFTAFVFRPGFNSSPANFSGTAGQKLTKNLAASEEARVSGSVVDEEKRPVPGALITAGDVDGERPMFGGRNRVQHDAITAPDGRFVLRIQPEADLQVNAAKKGMPSAKSATLRLKEGERKSGIVLTIPHGVTLSGRVVDAGGKPLSGVAVSADQASGNNFGMMFRRIGGDGSRERDNSIRTSSDGTFSARVREGLYDVTFSREGLAPKQLRGQQINASAKPLEVTMEPGAEIAGRVTRGGVGVEGVSVNAMTEAAPAGAITASDGSFRITDLPPGPVMVNVRKPDAFIQVMRNVTAPARDLNIDLPMGGRITGRVFDKASHNPITSFQAGINTSRSGGGRVMVMPPQLRSFTSDDGSFVLENVPPGDTQLVVNAPGYTSGRVPGLTVEDGKTIAGVEVGLDTGTRLTGRVTSSEGQPIPGATVRQGDGGPMRTPEGMATTDANGEFALEAVEPGEKTFQISASGYLSESRTLTLSGRDARLDVQLSSGTKVSGIVVTEAGAPVADAQVYVRGVGGMGNTRSARSDANGAFQLGGLAPGHYTFVAERTPYAQATVRDFDISSGAPLRMVMASGSTISGHVFGLGPTELSHAVVVAAASGDDAVADVDSNGNFRIEGAPSGTVRVQAMTRTGIAGASRNSPTKSVEVAPGAVAQIDLEFRSDTIVRGRVTRNGAPLANAMVDFIPRAGDSSTRVRTQSDASGLYNATGLEDGAYRVAVVDLERFTPYSTTYDVRGSGTFDIDIKAVPVRGRVTDSATGEGLVEARVELRSASNAGDFMGMRAATTDVNGGFVLDSVSPGSYHIAASKSGYGSEVRDVTVGDTPADAGNLALATTDGITLRVVDARDGRALSAMYRAYDAQGRIADDSVGRMFGGGDGGALKIRVPAGTFRVVLQAQGFATRNVTLSSPSQQTIGLTPGGTLVIRSSSGTARTARLLDGNGQAYERSLFGDPPIHIEPSPAVTPVSNLAPGTYTLQVMDENGKILGSGTKVTIGEGQTTEVSL